MDCFDWDYFDWDYLFFPRVFTIIIFIFLQIHIIVFDIQVETEPQDPKTSLEFLGYWTYWTEREIFKIYVIELDFVIN